MGKKPSTIISPAVAKLLLTGFFQVKRAWLDTLVTLDHFSHFQLMRFQVKQPLTGATQSRALWTRIFASL